MDEQSAFRSLPGATAAAYVDCAHGLALYLGRGDFIRYMAVAAHTRPTVMATKQ